jgi:AcrR family transcriptional regulator
LRSVATLEAIFEATLQVLIVDGARELTTTRVANRAGLSAAALYRYFPNRAALLSALNERHLGVLALRMNKTCEEQRGRSPARMVDHPISNRVPLRRLSDDAHQALGSLRMRFETGS